jgi:hypothetical protein
MLSRFYYCLKILYRRISNWIAYKRQFHHLQNYKYMAKHVPLQKKRDLNGRTVSQAE